MLTELYIENILLIDKVNIQFNNGFSVITGQTGAGKSILLDSLSIILGDRAGLSLIRDQNKNGIIMATFCVDSNKDNSETPIKQLLFNGGFIDNINDDTFIVKKIITKNGSKIFINDLQTTTQFVKSITRNLLEIYSQFEQTDLFTISKHLEILDNFGNFQNELENINKLYNDFKDANNEYIQTKIDIEKQKENIELLNDFVKDIRALNLLENEYDELLAKRREKTCIEKVATYISNASYEVNNSKLGQIVNKAQNNLLKAQDCCENETNLSKNISNANELLEKLYISFQITEEALNDLNSKYSFDETELNEIEDRISAINEISRKYQVQPNQLQEKYNQAEEKLKNIEISDEILEKLKQKLETKKNLCLEASRQLSQKRKQVSKKLEQIVLEKLSKLKMDKVNFYTYFEEKELTESGIDKVVFFASMNPGTQPSPIHKIASGGELSRFMLAFKSSLCEVQRIETIIFDEIDTGVSGNVAYAIGQELLNLSNYTQVICITHNPQTASCAKYHIFVSKEQTINSTRTTIKTLTGEERILAIAEMISSDTITEESIKNAKKLLNI